MDKINNDNSISQHSKTFSFASIFLPRKIKHDVYKMYQFCRSYDDSVDKDASVPDEQYETELNKLGINKKAIEQDNKFLSEQQKLEATEPQETQANQ